MKGRHITDTNTSNPKNNKKQVKAAFLFFETLILLFFKFLWLLCFFSFSLVDIFSHHLPFSSPVFKHVKLNSYLINKITLKRNN